MSNSTSEGGSAGGGGNGGATKAAWAPLRKRLALIRTVRIFSKDSSKEAATAAAAAASNSLQLPDDGGVYCGEDGGSSGCDLELDDCVVKSAGAKASPVLGGAAAAAERQDGENDDEVSSRVNIASCGGSGGGGGGSGGSSRGIATTAVGAPAHALFLRHRGSRAPDWACEGGRSSLGSGDFADEVRRLSSCSQFDEARRASGDLQQQKAAKTKKKSIGDKFSFLSRKSADASAAEKSSGLRAFRPSAEQVQRWGVSFDCLLNDKYGLALFRAFLKTEYSDENIEFWIACEEYRSIVGLKKQTLKAQKIYTEFVAFQAPREVNLDSTTRLATINAMGSPDSHLFEQAQKRIQALMEKDSYQRFLRSEVYQSLVKDAPAPGTSAAAMSSVAVAATAATATSTTPSAAATEDPALQQGN